MQRDIIKEARKYNQTIFKIDGVYHEIALKMGYSDSALSVIYNLANNGGSSLLSDIVRQSGKSKQTINSALRKLESDGIIVLSAANGKAKMAEFTEKGKSVAEKTANKIIECENRIYASWTEEEWLLFTSLTERFLNQLEKEKENM